jgi:hypothetical protein
VVYADIVRITWLSAWGHGCLHGSMVVCMGAWLPAWGHVCLHGIMIVCMGAWLWDNEVSRLDNEVSRLVVWCCQTMKSADLLSGVVRLDVCVGWDADLLSGVIKFDV